MPLETTALPDMRIRVDGRQLSVDPISATIEEDVGVLATFAIELYNWNDHALRFTWSDDDRVLPGTTVEISLGYVDSLTPVLTGEVTSLEPSFVADSPHRIIVRGFDRGHRLQRGRRTRSFVKMKDSDIANQLAREGGLSAKVTDSRITHDHVWQHNLSDWAFLSARAEAIGYILIVRDDTLLFVPPEVSARPVQTLRLSEDVESFHPRLSSRSQVDRVTVRGWDVKRKKEILAEAKAGQELVVGRGQTGPVQARKAFGPAQAAVLGSTVASRAQADARARAQLDRHALHFVTGDLVCLGQPGIHAGDVVAVEEAGARFSGRYYVAGVVHTVTMAAGYRTRLRLQRSAA